MNIAFDAQPIIESQKTGIGFYEYNIVKEFLKHWPENNYTFNCFRFRNPCEALKALHEFEELGGISNICAWFPSSFYRLIWNFIPVPYSLFLGNNADITCFFNYHVPPGVTGKKVVVVHDMAYQVFPETVRLRTRVMLNMSLKKSIKRADSIITISEFSKSEIVKYMGVDPSLITVAHCGVDTDIFYPLSEDLVNKVKQKYDLPSEYLLYTGTLEPRKNIERLIDAYAMLINENAFTPVLVLAGRKGWLYDSIFDKINSLGIEKRVIFTGYVDDGDMPALLSGALIFVFPSLYEGFGMPPLEAMACGIPVITSSAASLPEVAGDAAIMVDPYDTVAIKNGINRLINDAKLRDFLSIKGIERAKQFNWKRTASTIMNIYDN